MSTSQPREFGAATVCVNVLLAELRQELLAADMFRFERALPIIRVGQNGTGDGGHRKRIVRWTIYLVSADDLTGKHSGGRADRFVEVPLGPSGHSDSASVRHSCPKTARHRKVT